MITDRQTNFLYLADTLPKKYPGFFTRFEKVLNDGGIRFQLLPNTKDVWAVDYMPVQIEKNEFVQFHYAPGYLRHSKKWSKTISDVDAICNALGLLPSKSNIVLDGGNVIRSAGKVIMTDRIFSENPGIQEKELIRELRELFQVDKLIFIPVQPGDFTGHADGMVRFYNNDTVLINDYSSEDKNFQVRFRMALHNAGLDYIEIPYNPWNNKKDEQANGIYINFLQMQQGIVMPVFGMKEDQAAVRQMEELFPGEKIATVESNDLAIDGGLLNCITWNIQK